MELLLMMNLCPHVLRGIWRGIFQCIGLTPVMQGRCGRARPGRSERVCDLISRSQGGEAILAVVLKTAVEMTAPEGNDSVCSPDRPEHAGLLRRAPITVLQPASITPEPTKRR